MMAALELNIFIKNLEKGHHKFRYFTVIITLSFE